MSKKIYLSGQISGMCREEYTANFAKAEELLRKDGYQVINPTRTILSRWPLCRWVTYRHYLIYDIWLLLHCDYIYKLPGWRESRGAQIESCVAYHMNIFTLPVKVQEAYNKKVAKFMVKNHEKVMGESLPPLGDIRRPKAEIPPVPRGRHART